MKESKFFPLIYGLLSLLASSLISCEESSNSSLISDTVVQFTCSATSIDNPTRAYDTMWEAGDVVGIYMVPHTNNAIDAADLNSLYATSSSNIPYVTANDGSTVSLTVQSENSPISYPVNNTKVNFVAYYPYNSTLYTTNNNIYPIDIATQSPAKNIDLLYHKGTGTPYHRDSGEASLHFAHQLSKLIIKVIPAHEIVGLDLSTTTVTLSGFPTTANFNLSTGALSAQGTTDVSISPVKDAINTSSTQAQFQTILVPHTNSASYTRTVSFMINNKIYSYTLFTDWMFESGKQYNYTFKFTGDKIILSQNTIAKWDGGNIEWNNYQLAANRTNFELTTNATAGNTVTITTTCPTQPKLWLADNYNGAGIAEWITGVNIIQTTSSEGTLTYKLTFDTTTSSRPRTGYILLEFDKMTLAIQVNQSQWEIITDEANCYIVSPGRTISIPVTRAITLGEMSVTSSLSADKLWDDNNVVRNCYTSGYGDNATIIIATTTNEGNALVAVRDETGTICWSWHIWVTHYDPNATGGTLISNGYTIMDRNLGATITEPDTGKITDTYYQWGRKDPFIKGDSSVDIGAFVDLKTTRQNPTSFYTTSTSKWSDEISSWNSSPLINPCPKGYTVMHRNAIKSITGTWQDDWFVVNGTKFPPTGDFWVNNQRLTHYILLWDSVKDIVGVVGSSLYTTTSINSFVINPYANTIGHWWPTTGRTVRCAKE